MPVDYTQRIAQLEQFVENLIDMLATGELETSFEGETVKFADAAEIGKRIKMLRTEIARYQAKSVDASPRKIRGIQYRLTGDN